jgi:hypothetical protein
MMKHPLPSRTIEPLGTDAMGQFIEDLRSMTVVLQRCELRPGRCGARKPA